MWMLLSSSGCSPIGTSQQTIEQTRGRGLVSQLNHIHDTRARPLVAELDCNTSFADSLNGIGEYDGGYQQALFPCIGFHNQLLDIRGLLMIQLQLASTERLPLRMSLLQKDFALHLSGNDSSKLLRLFTWRGRWADVFDCRSHTRV